MSVYIRFSNYGVFTESKLRDVVGAQYLVDFVYYLLGNQLCPIKG